MLKISTTQLWVHDQEEALAFWTEKVGMELRQDVSFPEMGGFRWLTVGPPGQDDVSVVLMAIPGPPVMDAESREQVKTLMAKGFAGTVFLATDDCRASYEELSARGVEFTEPPEERPYGIDSGFRDPSGNSIRLTQVKEFAARLIGRAIRMAGSVTPSGAVSSMRLISSKPNERYSGSPGSVARRTSFEKPASRAARSQDSKIARPSPRRVQSLRTNIIRTRAGSVRGSSRRSSSSAAPSPVASLLRLLQPPHATISPACSCTKYVPSRTRCRSSVAMCTAALAVWRAS